MISVLLGLRWLLVALVMLGALPLLVANYQFLLVGVHFRRLHYGKCAPFFPRVAIIIPAWNEAAVIGTSVDRLMQLDYPPGALRVVDKRLDNFRFLGLIRLAMPNARIIHVRRDPLDTCLSCY